MIPLVMILKALIHTNDRSIFDCIVRKNHSDTFVTDRVELMLRSFKNYLLFTRDDCLSFLGSSCARACFHPSHSGSKFRVSLDVDEDSSHKECGEFLIRRVILVHLDSFQDKFNLLMFARRYFSVIFTALSFMVQKLYSLVAGECAVDNPDTAQHQEVLLGGFLYNAILKEKLDEYLSLVKVILLQDLRKNASVDFTDRKMLEIVLFISRL